MDQFLETHNATANDLQAVLRELEKAIAAAGNVQNLADKWKVSRQYIYMIRGLEVMPSRKMLKKLGFNKENHVRYVRANGASEK